MDDIRDDDCSLRAHFILGAYQALINHPLGRKPAHHVSTVRAKNMFFSLASAFADSSTCASNNHRRIDGTNVCICERVCKRMIFSTDIQPAIDAAFVRSTSTYGRVADFPANHTIVARLLGELCELDTIEAQREFLTKWRSGEGRWRHYEKVLELLKPVILSDPLRGWRKVGWRPSRSQVISLPDKDVPEYLPYLGAYLALWIIRTMDDRLTKLRY